MMAPVLMAGLDDLARFTAGAAVKGLWQGLLMTGLVAVGLRLVPRISAALRFRLWIAALVVVAGLPFIRGVDARGVAGVTETRSHAVWSLTAGWATVGSWSIAALWAAISLWRLSVLAREGVSLRSLWRESQIVDAAVELRGLLDCVPLRRVELCTSIRVDRPSVLGFFSPRILIPSWLYGELSEAELFQVVLHEVEHLRRGDDWLNLLQKLTLAVFPLSPALVWIEHRLCSERELACDDGVLRVTGTPGVYARCLTALAERRLMRRTAPAMALALGALGRASERTGFSELSRRVYRILRRQPEMRPVQAWSIAIVAIVMLAGGTVELSRSPELISFAGPEPSIAWERPVEGQLRFADFDARQAAPHMTLLKAEVPANDRPEEISAGSVSTGPCHGFRAFSAARAVAKPVPGSARPALKLTTKKERIPAWRVVQTGFEGEGIDRPDLPAIQASWIVITTIEERTDQERSEPRMILAVQTIQAVAAASPAQTADAPSAGPRVLKPYATVPAGFGWLIVQL